ncbi:MAG: helix-turn-helix domain-containing protein [Verrucomicrobia bacterium]|nr:helix-turn-helix domain-containing protein [Verrucomicrobiota bacterium]
MTDDEIMIQLSHRLMEQVEEVIDCTVGVGVLAAGKRAGRVLSLTPLHRGLGFTFHPGYEFPLHASAPGKALIAWLPDAELDVLLATYPFIRFNDNTITDRATFKKHLKQSREQGFTTDFAEEFVGCHCVGVPILNENGYPVATIWTTGPSEKVTARTMPGFAKKLNEAAREIARRLRDRTARDPDRYRALKVEQACCMIKSHLSAADFVIESVANELHVSYSWFRKAFKKETGLSPKGYFLRLKLDCAKELLSQGDETISESAERLGFESASYFSIFFKSKTGLTPSQFQKNTTDRASGGRRLR